MNRRFSARRSASVFGLFALLGLAACHFPDAVAPGGAVLTITASDDSIPVDGATTTLRITVLLESGDLLPYPASVSITTTEGTLALAQEAGGSSLLAKTQDGGLNVTLKSEKRAGEAVVVARSGDAVDTAKVVFQPKS